MRLNELVRSSRQRLVVPLVGQPGARLTGSTLLQNENNAELQSRSIRRLYEVLEPDAVFFMMNLTVEAGALGLPIRSPLNEPPTVEAHPIRCREDLDALRVVDPAFDCRVHTYVQTMRNLAGSPGIGVPKGAYVTGPFSLAGLLMGATEIAIATIENPGLVHAVVSLAGEVVGAYAAMLHEAGADMIAILEPTAVFLSPSAFDGFAGIYLRRLVSTIDTDWILHICGNATHLVTPMCATGVNGISLDADVDLPDVAARVPEDVVIMGNLHPVHTITLGEPHHVRSATTDLVSRMADVPNFVLSTGCDVPYEAPIENVRAFIDAARQG